MKSTVYNSSFFFFFFLFSIFASCSLLSHHVAVAFSLKSEGEALRSLMKRFIYVSGSRWNPPDYINLSWNNLSSSNTPCNWAGVICNAEYTHIVYLALEGVHGQLGSEIGQLKYLKEVAFIDNNFNGGIPTELWNCSHLQRLDLSRNNFTGELPEAVKNLHQLNFIDVSGNQLSGRIPQSLFQISGMEFIYLGTNNFSGSIPLNIGNATNLKRLFLFDNELHGIIPISIANCTKLENLELEQNGLNGEIPLGMWRIPTFVTISVEDNNLSGELPVEMTEIKQHYLTYISLSNNHFSGMIPKSLGLNYTSLQLVYFSNNNFSGEIPPNLCFGKQLLIIELSRNQFSGSIPQSYTGNCYSLTTLSLGGNKLTGSFPLFEKNTSGINNLDISINNIHGKISSICNLSNLASLDLSENQMTGTLPQCLGDSYALETMNLRNNKFSGSIPPNFTVELLTLLDLHGNRFEGKIPRIHSQNLRYLDLGNNQLEDTFPFFLEMVSFLDILVLGSNKLYGPLKCPHTRFTLKYLKVFDISSNYFTGGFPIELFWELDAMKHIDELDNTTVIYYPISTVVIHKGKELTLNQTLLDTFRAIDFSNNRFEGTIPELIGLLFLKSLNLSNNNLHGRIPSSLGNLTELESLDLSRNKLFGEIPWQLTNIHFLAFLNLSHNNLTGRIPNAGQFQTFSNDSFKGNIGLCGYQSSSGCVDVADKERRWDPIEEKECNEDSKFWNFGWEPVVIGYGCGIVIGLVIQYFLFTKSLLYRWFG